MSRSPTPQAIKLLHGTLRPDRDPAQAMLPAARPAPPPGLGEIALAEFNRAADAMPDILAEVDSIAVALYAVAFERWQKAEAQIIATGGEIVRSPAGFAIVNPWFKIAREAAQQMNTSSVSLGLSPAHSAKINVGQIPVKRVSTIMKRIREPGKPSL